MTTSQGLSFSGDTFAKLAPDRYLQAYLSEQHSRRPNGRRQDEFRTPVINTGSLAHSNGSAVVRLGNTAVVCGIRGEILLASDIPNPPTVIGDDQIQQLGLIVPNLELSTGCSQSHLPGNPPSSIAQSLSWRLHNLLHSSRLVQIRDLQIQHIPPVVEEGEDPAPLTKAYWTLYIDILCISLDGACLDAAWVAVLAALRSTRLPRAQWDADREAVICSPQVQEAKFFQLRSQPVLASFVAFSTASVLKRSSEAKHWLIADPDTFEEDTCRETISVTIDDEKLLRIERSGGASIGPMDMKHVFELARQRWQQVTELLRAG